MTTIFYLIFGSARRAPDRTWIYHRDPFYVFLVLIPFLAGLFGTYQTIVEMVIGSWLAAAVCSTVSMLLFRWALYAHRDLFVLIPAPDMFVRQIFGTPRCLRGCRVFVSQFIGTKTIAFPGESDISQGETDPAVLGSTVGGAVFTIESPVEQPDGNPGRQKFTIQTIANLAVDEQPARVIQQFYGEFSPGSLEKQRGGTWGDKVRACIAQGWVKVRNQIRTVVASHADEVLSDGTKWNIEKMMKNRKRLNDDMSELLNKPLMDKLGVRLSSVVISDIKDAADDGWIALTDRTVAAQNRSRTEQAEAAAEQASALARAASFERSEVAMQQAELAVAKQRVETAKEQAKAELEVQKIQLQQLIARLEVLATDAGQRAALSSALLKFDGMPSTDVVALAKAVTEAFGKPPQTVVSLGGDLANMYQLPAIISTLMKAAPGLFAAFAAAASAANGNPAAPGGSSAASASSPPPASPTPPPTTP